MKNKRNNKKIEKTNKETRKIENFKPPKFYFKNDVK